MVKCKSRMHYFFIICGLLIVGIFKLNTVSAGAFSVQAHFGSENYEWVNHEENMIGIYVTADEALTDVNYIIEYDASALDHALGGEDLGDGRIQIQGEGIEAAEFKRMIKFIPLRGGDTEIRISEIQTSGESGETAIADPVMAKIHVPVSESCYLDNININGSDIEGFDKNITEYTLHVDADVEQLDINTFPAERNVDISETNLQAGNNDVYIAVNGDDGNKAVYTLHVERAESMSPAGDADNGEQQTSSDAGEKDLKLADYEHSPKGFLAWCKNNVQASGYIAALVILIIVLIVLTVFRFKIKHRDRKNQKEEISWISVGGPEYEPEKEQSDDVAISVDHVTMEFTRERDESGSIKELVIRFLKGERKIEKFRALDNISFDVKKGEVVGIIGTNGSGKSTILKIISGVLRPTRGKVDVEKNKIQLLTLGTGFDKELTGKENVYLNGALIGYSQKYIDEHYDDIVKFAELDGFMEERVKNYSSGMVSRLGFAIATARTTPEILILDEVLSVGDIFFRKKSEKRIKEMIHGGSTVIIVSHSTAVIRNNCTKVVWIERGKLRAIGTPEKVCAAYEKMNTESS